MNEDTVFATGTGGPPGSESPALTAIDRESGERRWKIDGPFTWGTAVGGDTLVVPTDVEFCENGSSRSGCTFDDRALDMGGLNGLDPTTGDVRWSIREERFGEENGNAVLVGDRIYYTDDEGLHALS